MTHKMDVGYDLQSRLLVSDTTGQPIVAGKTIDTCLVVSRIVSDSGEVRVNGRLISNVMDILAEAIANGITGVGTSNHGLNV